MTDRPVLADALAGATVEMLREWAGVATTQADDVARLWRLSSNDSPELQDRRAERVKAFRGMAALALAIASASNTSDARIEQAGRADYLILDIPMPETHTMGYGACELIPALAATLRGAP